MATLKMSLRPLNMKRLMKQFKIALQDIHVPLYEDFSCCQSCGHAELQRITYNYLFYHEQARDDKTCCYYHSLDKRTAAKLFLRISRDPNLAQHIEWDGTDKMAILLTAAGAGSA